MAAFIEQTSNLLDTLIKKDDINEIKNLIMQFKKDHEEEFQGRMEVDEDPNADLLNFELDQAVDIVEDKDEEKEEKVLKELKDSMRLNNNGVLPNLPKKPQKDRRFNSSD